MSSNQAIETGAAAFAPLCSSDVALLTSFRRNGQGISTPVGMRVLDGKAYFITWHTTGKVKRIANNPRVTLAPCTRAGKAIGPTVEGIARRLEGTEAVHWLRVLTASVWGKLWLLAYRLRRWRPIVYEVSPAPADPAAA